jgi:hypothetical protein
MGQMQPTKKKKTGPTHSTISTFSVKTFLQTLLSQEYMSIQENLNSPVKNDSSLDH